ncbi:MAG: Protein TolB [Alphaproteobacteria bacterium MarineAlpha9_Bin3]|nr:MAG: Protein TolB [Alphaproteobacteria bacterium MarineAlpha9_Bin3]|tara:strand:- start:3857 stop:5221 length:1365 start_codon:yes stop_codon:yes gene_type:complete
MLKYILKFNIYFYIIFSITLISFTNISKSADRPLQIDIMGGNIQAMPIAISYFASDENIKKLNLHKNIPNLIANNLINSGLFKLLDRNAYMQSPEQLLNPPKYRDWRIIDAQALISGKISKKNNDKISVSIELWDVYGEKRMFGLSLSSKTKSWRRISHIISDKIYERLTGEEGYFDTRIVYVSESGSQKNKIKRLAIMDQDGGNHKYLTDGKSLVLTPRFSPNQQLITFFSYSGVKAGLKPSVYLYNLSNGKIEILGQFPGMSFAPRFSPDGEDLIMSLAENGSTNIYMMNLNTRKTRQLTKGRSIDTSPSFSPDGKNIVFNSDRSGGQHLYIMKRSGEKPKRISFGRGSYATPVWSPRGDYIAFTKFTRGRFFIGLMRPDGSEERLIAEGYLTEGPTWAPGGRVLSFFRQIPQNNGSMRTRLFVIDITGYRERELDTPEDASDPAWSPKNVN